LYLDQLNFRKRNLLQYVTDFSGMRTGFGFSPLNAQNGESSESNTYPSSHSKHSFKVLSKLTQPLIVKLGLKTQFFVVG
jgi:hypothetical protein